MTSFAAFVLSCFLSYCLDLWLMSPRMLWNRGRPPYWLVQRCCVVWSASLFTRSALISALMLFVSSVIWVAMVVHRLARLWSLELFIFCGRSMSSPWTLDTVFLSSWNLFGSRERTFPRQGRSNPDAIAWTLQCSAMSWIMLILSAFSRYWFVSMACHTEWVGICRWADV